MKPTSLSIRLLSVLLSVVMIMSIFTILPTSVFAAEKDTAAVSAEADIAEVSALEFEEPQERIFVANSGESITIISAGLMDWNYSNTYFQWYRVTDEGDVAVEGATSDMFDAPIPDTPGDTYTYYCIVRRGSETARSYDHLVTRTTEWDSRYMSGPIEDIVLESSVRDQFGMYPNMTCDNFFTEVYRTNGCSYDDPVMVNCDYTSGYLTINDDEWQEGESRYYYIYFKPTSSLYFRSNVFKVTKPADYDPTPNLNITVGTIFNPVPTKEAPSWRDSESEGIFQYKGARTYAYFFTPFDDKEHSLTDLAVTFYRCDNEDGTGNISVLGRAHADDLSAYPGVNDDAAFENDLKCLLPSDTAGVYYVYAEYTAAANGVSFNKTTGVTRVTVEDVSYEDYFRFDASTGTITGYYGCEDTIVYPAEIKGVKVKKIRTTELTDSTVNSAQQPFQDVYRTCRKAILPEGLEQIPEYTFLGEKFLEEANVPNSVTRINRYSFYRCARLKSVTVGDSDDNGSSRLSYIEGGAFCFSDVLEKLDFGSCGTNISSNVTKNRAPFGFLPALTEFIAPANAQMNLNFNTANYPFNRSSELKQITNIANINRSGIPNRNYITVPHIFFMLRDKQETAEYDESFIYYPDEENEGWTIGGYLRKVAETDGELIFPDTFMGKKITRIGAGNNIDYSLFEFGNYPLRLVIGQYVKEIGAHAFEDAFSRGEDFETKAEVVLPASLTTIGAYAFSFTDSDSAATRLGKVNLSDTSVNFIGEAAFKDQFYSDFGDLVFHSDVTVEDYAFMISDPIWEHDYEYINHDALLSVTVDGSAAIGYRAFYRHSTLKSVTVGGTLTLDQDAFDKCYYIENVSFGESEGTFGSLDGGGIIDGKIVDDSRGFSHFRYTPAFPEVTDTQPVQGYTDLNADHKQTWERTYKRSDNIGYYVDRCEIDSEETVQGTIAYTFEPSVRLVLPGRIEDDAIQIVDFTTLLDFYDQTQEYSLNIGEGINLLLNTTEYWHPYDDSAPHHGARNRYYLTNCSSIHFPSTVELIPSHFLFNAKLKGTVEIPGTVERIDHNAFALNEIDTLILHEGTKYIGAGAFSTGICSLDYGYGPASDFTSSLDYAYNTFDKETPNVKHIVTAEKRELKEADTLPDSVETVGRYAFADCGLNSRLILPSGVEQLGSGAFYRTGITEVMSQGGVINSFGSGAFENCLQLKKVDFSNTTVKVLGEKSFATDYSEREYSEDYTTELHSSIEELYLPKGLVTVGADALLLVNPAVIHLPDSVTEYNVKYPPVVKDNDTPYTVNGKTLQELSITIPENTAIISRSLFNLGTVTFLNRDQEVKTKRESYGTVLTEDLPSSIPEYCTVRCYEDSYIYQWCVNNDINYELIEDDGDAYRSVKVVASGALLGVSDLASVKWIDESTHQTLGGGLLRISANMFDPTHVVSCEITFTDEDYNRYETSRTRKLLFDPAAENFSSDATLSVIDRAEVTIKGSFGDQVGLSGFTLSFGENNGAVISGPDFDGDGSFTAVVKRGMGVSLFADVDPALHYLPVEVKDVTYRGLDADGCIDLGQLTFMPEPIVPVIRMVDGVGKTVWHYGTAILSSADGTKHVEFTCYAGTLFTPNLRDTFDIEEEVRLELRSPHELGYHIYQSDLFRLSGTRSAIEQKVQLYSVNAPEIIFPGQMIPLLVNIYDENGDLVNPTGNTRYGYHIDANQTKTYTVIPGRYTLVVLEDNRKSVPVTLDGFHEAFSEELAVGYIEKQLDLGFDDKYYFTEEVPGYLPLEGINADVSFNKSIKNPDGSIPMYVHLSYSDVYVPHEGDRMTVKFTYNRGTPFVKVDDHFATLSDGGTIYDEVLKTTASSSNNTLTITTDAKINTLCLYVIPNGEEMQLAVNNYHKKSFALPAERFSAVRPPEVTSEATGTLAVTMYGVSTNSEFFDGDYKRYAYVIVDGAAREETYEYTVANLDQQCYLDYDLTVPYAEAGFHTVQVAVCAGERPEDGSATEERIIWESEKYEVKYVPETVVPVPTRMDMRITNDNAVWNDMDEVDGVKRVEYASLDLRPVYNTATERYEYQGYRQMKFVVPYWFYNEDGTMAKDITIDYYLSVENPAAVTDKTVMLDVYCCESSPYIKKVYLTYNPNTNTFDGSLYLPGGTITINDLPYGFDLYLPNAADNLDLPDVAHIHQAYEEMEEKLDDSQHGSGLNEDVDAIYHNKIDLEEISFVLNNAVAFENFTDEEKQLVMDAAIAENNLHDAYHELETAVAGVLENSSFDLGAFAQIESTDDLVDLLFTGTQLHTVTSVPETLNPEMLEALGFQFHERNDEKGNFYTRISEGGSLSVILEKANLQFDFSAAADVNKAAEFAAVAAQQLSNGQDDLAAVGAEGDLAPSAAYSLSPAVASRYYEERANANTAENAIRSDITTYSEMIISWLNTIIPCLALTGSKLNGIEKSIEESLLKEGALTEEMLAKLPADFAKTTACETKTINGKTFYILTEEGMSFLGRMKRMSTIEALAESLSAATSARSLTTRLMESFASVVETGLSAGRLSSSLLTKIAQRFAGVASTGKWLSNILPVIGGIISAALTIVDMFVTYYDMTEIEGKIGFTREYMFDPTVKHLEEAISGECDLPQYYADKLFTEIADYYEDYALAMDDTARTFKTQMLLHQANFTVAITTAFPGLSDIPQIAAGSLIVGLVLTVAQTLEVARYFSTSASRIWGLDKQTQWFQQDVDRILAYYLMCPPRDETPKDGPLPGEDFIPKYPTPPSIAIDPSGYVYEAVASNRVEGATAEIYYKGDDGEAVYWDEAADHNEINPQTTDSFGEYGWMTPIGKWLVKITKDGYEDADSRNDPAADEDGWLPVPPPQLNVDIPLVSKAVPAVENIAASGQTVAIRFSQYMDIAALDANPSLITITENGESVPLSFTFTDSEESPTQEGVFYGRILRIARTDGKHFSDSVAVSISKDFANYAGNGFAADFAQTVAVGQIPNEISHSYPNRLVMVLSDEQEVCVRITDEDGAPVTGETVAIKALYGDLLTIESTTAVTDEDGVARFRVKGIRSGDELLTFTLDNGVKATMKLRVKAPGDIAPEKPAANLNDFAVVESGTELVLTCDTEGAVIYYTTDDTCPCQDTESRKEYTGPIKLTESGFYRIAAYNDEGGYSERINLHITVTETMPLLGDVDRDGEVEIRDATWIQRSVADIEIPFTIKKLTADADGDGKITVMDATLIQYYLANMKNPYNIGKTVS